MGNERKVIWSDEADKNLETILNYLQAKWTSKEVQSFLSKLEKAITLISNRPKLFRETSSRKNLRKCVLNK
jgi:plasmid stabilization system protein ParE